MTRARSLFYRFEYVLGADLPDEVFEDPVFMSLYWAAADMVCWSNVSVLFDSPLYIHTSAFENDN